MTGLGIGLGGFIQGLEGGINARESIDRKKRQDAEYDRAVKQRDAIDAINSDSKAEYDKEVADGTQKPDNYDAFWQSYALPKLKNQYLAQGNYDMADKLQKWGDSEDARKGVKLSMSAMYKASIGDHAGAISDAIKAGEIKGYLNHGYELEGQQNILDPKTGQTVGYRLNVKTPEGEKVQQDIPVSDVPRIISTMINPEAAWQTQIQSQAADAKDQRDLNKYRAEKLIDRQLGISDKAAGRSAAISTLRKRLDGGIDGKSPTFDDLPSDQQEALISKEMQLQSGPESANVPGIGIGAGTPIAPVAPQAAGGPAPPSSGAPPPAGRNVIVDKATGQIVPPTPPAVQQRPPAATSPAPPNPATYTPETREEHAQSVLRDADYAAQQGDNPERIADNLKQNGIPDNMWPDSLRRALARPHVGQPIGIN